MLWRLTACALDMHLDMAIPHDLIHLSSSMLGRRKDLIMEMLIIGTQRIRCQFLTNDDLFVQVQDIKFLEVMWSPRSVKLWKNSTFPSRSRTVASWCSRQRQNSVGKNHCHDVLSVSWR